MRTLFIVLLCVSLAAPLAAQSLPSPSQIVPAGDQPVWLKDRGTGIASSMFGTYIRKGELLFYPFFEWYADSNFEYKPSEHGFGLDVDHRGRYHASEGLVFLGYGLTNNLLVEFEAAVITAELRKSPSDPSAMPARITESGLGDVEMQVRWRFAEESATRPEAFTYFETVFPLQRDRTLIGTQDWEYKIGLGIARGHSWGTTTFRVSADYTRLEHKWEPGEFGVDYFKRLSPAWRVLGGIEVNQLDEVALVTEAQWHFTSRVSQVEQLLGTDAECDRLRAGDRRRHLVRPAMNRSYGVATPVHVGTAAICGHGGAVCGLATRCGHGGAVPLP